MGNTRIEVWKRRVRVALLYGAYLGRHGAVKNIALDLDLPYHVVARDIRVLKGL